MTSTVSEKGQVTIPKAVRDKLGLRPGTVLEFEAVEGKLVGVKQDRIDPFRKWVGKGRLPGGKTVDAYLREVRA
jgi:antitoxin PrlF